MGHFRESGKLCKGKFLPPMKNFYEKVTEFQPPDRLKSFLGVANGHFAQR
jgi:hypothetical protein